MIRVENLSKEYKSKNKNNCVALKNISFELPEKGLVFIVGKSGSGKSTLLNLIGGLDNVTSGSINVFGNEISILNEKQLNSYRSSLIGFIFQDFHLLEDLTIEENIALSLKLNNQYEKSKIEKALKQVDLEGFNSRYPTELSGGQKQRVAIARALIKNPDIILADEPTGNLDSKTTKQIIELIKKISKDKLVVVVSHNLYDAYDYGDRIIELSDGVIINDLIINDKYSNVIKKEGNQIIIPSTIKFSEEELNKLLTMCKSNDVVEIKQANDKFITYNKKIERKSKANITKTNLKTKEVLKFSYLFGKKRFGRFVLSSLMAAIIVVVLALSQSIAYFNPSVMISENIDENTDAYCVRKNIDNVLGETRIKSISDEEIVPFEEKGIQVYKLYNETLINTNTYKVSKLELPSDISKNLYTSETYGTLVTTPEYAKKVLGVEELEIYTGDVTYQKYGMYITDYFADAFLYNAGITSYDDILGDCLQIGGYTWCWGYINGIIKTDYKTKYSSLIEDTIKGNLDDELSEEEIDFYDYIIHSLAITYSFEESFIEEICNTPHYKSFQWVYNNYFNGVETTSSFTYMVAASYYGVELKENEIIMHYDLYNKIFKTDYNLSNVDSFVPHQVHFHCSDEYGAKKYDGVFTIKAIGKTTGSSVMASDKIFIDLKKAMTVCYGLYFDGEDMTNAIQYAIDNNYIAISMKMSAIQTMSKAVSIFKEFFDLIVFILLVGCGAIIVSFGVKNINSRKYEIGILKALGCNFASFETMFFLHTVVVALLIILFQTIGFAIFSDLANDILVESLKKLAVNHVMLDLQFISFDINLMIFDAILVVLISLLSSFVPTVLLKRIKPISIIKAKE